MSHRHDQSLWLSPLRQPLEADPRRWAHYPYFLDALEENLGSVLPSVRVEWLPFSDVTRWRIEADDEEHAAEVVAFIDDVARRIECGDDVPPILRVNGSFLDGRHRCWAAQSLGIKLAPTIVEKWEPPGWRGRFT